MDIDEFWDLIETSRPRNRRCSEHASRLQLMLEERHPDEIVAFQRHFEQCMEDSYRWDLWAVAYIIKGGCSDDSFDYFRAWLIGQGRSFFEAAMKDPERAADRDGWLQRLAGFVLFFRYECEDLLSVAYNAHERRTGQPPPTDVRPQTTPGPMGTRWTEEELPDVFPALWKRYPLLKRLEKKDPVVKRREALVLWLNRCFGKESRGLHADINTVDDMEEIQALYRIAGDLKNKKQRDLTPIRDRLAAWRAKHPPPPQQG